MYLSWQLAAKFKFGAEKVSSDWWNRWLGTHIQLLHKIPLSDWQGLQYGRKGKFLAGRANVYDYFIPWGEAVAHRDGSWGSGVYSGGWDTDLVRGTTPVDAQLTLGFHQLNSAFYETRCRFSHIWRLLTNFEYLTLSQNVQGRYWVISKWKLFPKNILNTCRDFFFTFVLKKIKSILFFFLFYKLQSFFLNLSFTGYTVMYLFSPFFTWLIKKINIFSEKK